jgi:NAD(P)-dependent dehydrogenase (short-subunit alcohol dehydrogenase family)
MSAKDAIVFGGSRGIGSAIALRLAPAVQRFWRAALHEYGDL